MTAALLRFLGHGRLASIGIGFFASTGSFAPIGLVGYDREDLIVAALAALTAAGVAVAGGAVALLTRDRRRRLTLLGWEDEPEPSVPVGDAEPEKETEEKPGP